MSYWVYVHTNKVNGKRYVGQTIQDIPEKRWGVCGHGYCANVDFVTDIYKYGWDSFDHTVYEVDTKEEMDYLEEYLCMYYESWKLEKGYNRSRDGKYFQKMDSLDKPVHYRKHAIQRRRRNIIPLREDGIRDSNEGLESVDVYCANLFISKDDYSLWVREWRRDSNEDLYVLVAEYSPEKEYVWVMLGSVHFKLINYKRLVKNFRKYREHYSN